LGILDWLRGGRDQRPTDAALAAVYELDDDEVVERMRAALRAAGYSIVGASDETTLSNDWVLRRRGERTLLRLSEWRARRVGLKRVRELFEAMQEEGASGCKLVTCGACDDAARAFARGKPIELFDGAILLRELPQLALPAARVSEVASPNAEFVPSGLPENPAGSAAQGPLCPRCRGRMILRHAGVAAGAVEYWACAQFPRCPGTRPGDTSPAG
jgi:restriction system protein